MGKRFNLYIIFGLFLAGFLPMINQSFSLNLLSMNSINLNFKTNQIYTGNYNGEIAIMYFDQDSIFSSEFNTQSITQRIPHNFSRPGYEYKVISLDILAELSYVYKID